MSKTNKPLTAHTITFSREQHPPVSISLDKYSGSTLIDFLQRAIDNEEYEEAVIYRDELSKRVKRAGL